VGAMFFKGFKHVVGRILRDYFSRAGRSSKILMWWVLQKKREKKVIIFTSVYDTGFSVFVVCAILGRG
jgi:hypothetical protein